MKKTAILLLALLLLCLLPLVSSPYMMGVFTEIYIMGIMALSLNVLVGYTGLVSLGHAAFFGAGAYAAAIVAKHISPNLFLTLFSALVIAAIVAAVIGYFSTKVNGFYFLMITLAFSQMLYAVVFRWTSLTGGSDGLSGIPRPSLAGGVLLDNPNSLYYTVLIALVIVFIAIKLLIASPFGQVFIGIRENEMRMRAIGYNTAVYKNLSFVIAGAVGGVAGGLYSYLNAFVSPGDVYWTMSAEALIMVLVGGSGTLIGPLLGAAFIVLLETIISSYTELWMLIIGAVFIFFVIFLPKGIVGGFGQLTRLVTPRKNRTLLPSERKGYHAENG